MEIDLSKIGMDKGQQYETIITTINNDGTPNAAPFGVRVLDKDKVQLRIFEGGNTIKNIREKEEFIVNITENPLMFTFATIDTIPEEYLTKIDKKTKDNNELVYLSKTDAYFICEVETLKTAFRENDPIKDTEINMIKANVDYTVSKNFYIKNIDKYVLGGNYSRINIVDEKKQKYFMERFLESERIIKRVGKKEEKESIQILKENLKNQGFDF